MSIEGRTDEAFKGILEGHVRKLALQAACEAGQDGSTTKLREISEISCMGRAKSVQKS